MLGSDLVWELLMPLEELSAQQISLLLLGVLAMLISLGVTVIVRYVLTSMGLARIARMHGARRRIVRLSWIPFARYYTVGMLAERCDARRGKQIRLQGKTVAAVGISHMPIVTLLCVAALALIVVSVVILLLVLLIDKVDLYIGSVPGILQIILTVLGVMLVAFVLLVPSIFIILLPLLGVVCALLACLLAVAPTVLSYVCYAKMLREHFPAPVRGVLTAVSVLLGLFPITLLIASYKEPLPAAAYDT